MANHNSCCSREIPSPKSNPATIGAKSGNTISFDLTVQDGAVYRFETSTNLVDWITSFSFTASGTTRPVLDFADRDTMRFYRIVREP